MICKKCNRKWSAQTLNEPCPWCLLNDLQGRMEKMVDKLLKQERERIFENIKLIFGNN